MGLPMVNQVKEKITDLATKAGAMVMDQAQNMLRNLIDGSELNFIIKPTVKNVVTNKLWPDLKENIITTLTGGLAKPAKKKGGWGCAGDSSKEDEPIKDIEDGEQPKNPVNELLTGFTDSL